MASGKEIIRVRLNVSVSSCFVFLRHLAQDLTMLFISFYCSLFSPISLQNQGPSPHPGFIWFMLLRELSGFGDEISSCMWLFFMGELGNHHALYIITRAFKDMDSVFGLTIPTHSYLPKGIWSYFCTIHINII
jgi:hypothetical protein